MHEMDSLEHIANAEATRSDATYAQRYRERSSTALTLRQLFAQTPLRLRAAGGVNEMRGKLGAVANGDVASP